jgi:18S rRNA (adenine1779-N6/adenine1780-N6)-dimethyltransferase
MPKVNRKKRNSAPQSSPYAEAAAKTKAASNIFKMNKDIGQHVLRNPGVSDVCFDLFRKSGELEALILNV